MAEERTIGLARAREAADEEPSKEALQRRMEEARDSITNTVSEIKENVAQQVETVKDALDWREHFKRRPVAWGLGAAGVGFFVGYGVAAAFSDDEKVPPSHVFQTQETYARPLTGEPISQPAARTNGKHEGPGMLDRFKDTSAYERLSKEAGAIGDRLIEELSTTAQAVVLPVLLSKIKHWIGVDLLERDAAANKTSSMKHSQAGRSVSHEPSLGRPSEV